LGGEDGQAKAAKKAKLVISVGKSVVRVLAGEVVKGDRHHGGGKGGEVGADMGRGGGARASRALFHPRTRDSSSRAA
jgi:hypothetical protein